MCRHLDWVLERDDVDPSRLLYHGVSVGGSIAAGTAAHRSGRYRPAAMVLQSAFYSVARMGASYYVPEFLARLIVGGCLNTADCLRRLNCSASGGDGSVRLILAHGSRDSVVPFAHSEALAREAGVEVYARACDHNDFPMPGAARGCDMEWTQRLAAFTRAALGPK